MTRPVAEILEQAQREGWPTSSIDAMANHHLCGSRARDYVNDCFAERAEGEREIPRGGGGGGMVPRVGPDGGQVAPEVPPRP